MVTMMKMSRNLIWLAALLLLTAGEANAAVLASVDRVSVELNESFTLKLTVDVNLDTEPDISVLDADFVVHSRSQMSKRAAELPPSTS